MVTTVTRITDHIWNCRSPYTKLNRSGYHFAAAGMGSSLELKLNI